jgi:hypothetical protein
MSLRSIELALALVLPFVIADLASAAPLDKSNLVGTWNYTSYTLLEDGRPSGTAHFAPGALVFTYREDGTWEMEAADATHTRLSGSYEIRGSELIMKKADGSPYQDFQVEMDNQGQEMTMRDKRSIVTASKANTTH